MPRRIEDELETWRDASLLRKLREIESRDGATIRYAGRALTDFSSNDYLGLSGADFLKEAAKQAIDAEGVGSAASRLVCGTRSSHLRLEEKLAAFKGAEAALGFSSGYAASVGVVNALVGKGDIVILDKLAHASLIDGARMSGATLRVYPHNNLEKLEAHLQWAAREHQHHPKARVLVVTESVFSMDGDRAPLAALVALKERYGALLLLDEAHAVGVIGREGRGLADREGVSARVDVQMGTLSKALGVSGGYVCGSRALIDFLINRARSFVYSTAPAPALAEAACAALDFLQTEQGEERRKKLWQNIRILAEGLPPRLAPERIQSAIIPIIIGDEGAALSAANLLYEQGFFVPAIRYPTVAKGSARLRVTLSAAHEEGEIRRLTAALRSISEQIEL